MLAARLFGRHVVRRAEQLAGGGQRRRRGVGGEAEVDDDRRAVGAQQHVGGLQIAVQHAGGVRGTDAAGQRGDEAGDAFPRRARPRQGHRRAFAALPARAVEPGRERAAGDVFHDQPGDAAGRVLADVDDGDEVRVAQPAQHLRRGAAAPARGRSGGGARDGAAGR